MKYVLSVAEWKEIEKRCITDNVDYDEFQKYILNHEFEMECSFNTQYYYYRDMVV